VIGDGYYERTVDMMEEMGHSETSQMILAVPALQEMQTHAQVYPKEKSAGI